MYICIYDLSYISICKCMWICVCGVWVGGWVGVGGCGCECMYVCMYVCMYIYIYINIYTYIHTYVHTYIHTYMSAGIYLLKKLIFPLKSCSFFFHEQSTAHQLASKSSLNHAAASPPQPPPPRNPLPPPPSPPSPTPKHTHTHTQGWWSGGRSPAGRCKYSPKSCPSPWSLFPLVYFFLLFFL
jgi:hypothetical protein